MMTLLPAMEVLAREVFGTGITGSIVTVQHLTLWIGFLGAALAAREGRLLSLTGETDWLRQRLGPWSGILADGVAVGVTLVLAVASYRLMITEMEYPRTIIGPIQVWMAQLAMPGGFTLIAWRLLRRSSNEWRYRAKVLLVAALLGYLGIGLELQDGWAVYAVGAGDRYRIRFARPDQFPEFANIETWAPAYDASLSLAMVLEADAAIASEEAEEDSEAEDE